MAPRLKTVEKNQDAPVPAPPVAPKAEMTDGLLALRELDNILCNAVLRTHTIMEAASLLRRVENELRAGLTNAKLLGKVKAKETADAIEQHRIPEDF
jgi:hypothetical protein